MTIGADKKAIEKRKHLNTRANELRDVADKDYIAARSLYRCCLMDQFYWSSLQSLEKYLKSTLLLHQLSASEFSHNFTAMIKKLEEDTFVRYELEPIESDFLKRVERFGQDRYVDSAVWSEGGDLVWLDRTIWAVRRWCQTPRWTSPNGQTTTIEKQVTRAQHEGREHKYRLVGGYLEKLVKPQDRDPKKSHRAALIWNNMYFGQRTRHSVGLANRFQYRRSHHHRDKEARSALKGMVRL